MVELYFQPIFNAVIRHSLHKLALLCDDSMLDEETVSKTSVKFMFLLYKMGGEMSLLRTFVQDTWSRNEPKLL